VSLLVVGRPGSLRRREGVWEGVGVCTGVYRWGGVCGLWWCGGGCL
jgi:hypothetical protein